MATILAVDDEDMIARMIMLRLELAGHDVTVANNGQAGLELALEHPYDLILMDMDMPVMDGYEAVRLLRTNHCENVIVAVTGSVMRDEIQKALVAGCNNFIAKPLGDDFEQRIAGLLNDQ